MGEGKLIPGAYSRRFTGWFSRWIRGMFNKRFNAVRAEHGTAAAMRSLADHPGPIIVLLNHSSWWDPLTCVLAADLWMPGRTPAAPMDATQLEKFGIFKKLGIFGVDPDDAAGLRAMTRYVIDIFENQPLPTLWITPQGRFADVRSPIVVRPGAASIAAAVCRSERLGAGTLRVVSLSVEYGFWHEQRPELFLRAIAVDPPADPASTGGWRRAMETAMNANAAALATAVMSRDPERFEVVAAGRAARTNPLYDLWLKVRGRKAELEVDHRRDAQRQSSRDAMPPASAPREVRA